MYSLVLRKLTNPEILFFPKRGTGFLGPRDVLLRAAMTTETTPELEALVLSLFEIGAVKVRASHPLL